MKKEISSFANNRKVILRLKSYISSFEKKYYEAKSIKKTHVNKDAKAVKETVIIIILTAFIAVAIGLITNSISNLSYVLNILNTITLGSFIMYKVIKEKRIQLEFTLEYNIIYTILFDILEFAVLIITTSLLIQLMYLYNFSSVITLIGYSIILLIGIVLYYFLHPVVYIGNQVASLLKVLFLALILTISFGLIVHLLPITNIMLNFSITYLLLFWIYYFISIMTTKYKSDFTGLYSILGIIILICIYSFTKNAIGVSSANFNSQFFQISSYTADYDHKIAVKDYNSTLITDDYILINYTGYTEFYNHNFQFVRTIPMNEENIYADEPFYEFDNNEIYYIEKANEDSDTTLYTLTDDFELEFLLSSAYDTTIFYPFEEHYIINRYKVTFADDFDLASTVTEANTIIEMNDTYLLYSENEYYIQYVDSHFSNDFEGDYMFYDEGKVLFTENSEWYISDAEDFLTKSIEHYTLVNEAIRDGENKLIRGFEVTDHMYIITYGSYSSTGSDAYFYKYLGNDGELLYSLKGIGYNNDYQVCEGDKYIYFSDIESSPILIVNDTFSVSIDILFVLALTINSYLILPSLILKGGK